MGIALNLKSYLLWSTVGKSGWIVKSRSPFREWRIHSRILDKLLNHLLLDGGIRYCRGNWRNHRRRAGGSSTDWAMGGSRSWIIECLHDQTKQKKRENIKGQWYIIWRRHHLIRDTKWHTVTMNDFTLFHIMSTKQAMKTYLTIGRKSKCIWLRRTHFS